MTEARAGGGPDLPAERTSAAAQLGRSPRRTLYRGRDPARATSIEDLRAMAHRRMPRFALEYLEAGAGEEGALAGNLAALRRWRFLRRALVDVSKRDLGCTLFGTSLPLPVAIAPSGLNGVFRHRADSLLAMAAADARIPFTQSAMSNDSIEDVAAAAPEGRRWFQLYVVDPPEMTDDLIARAQAAGCAALVVTTDAQMFGKRSWSARERSSAMQLRPAEILDAALHLRWLASTLLPAGIPRFRNFRRWLPPEKSGLYASAFWIRHHMDKGLDWDRIGRIRDRWRGPLLLKGLLRAEDALRAIEIGAQGIVLSNHGGRQLDWSVAPLDMLAEVRAAVGRRIAILADGGIRSGGDIAKMLALGANAVLVGRATLYGVAAAGKAGAARAIEILRDEFDLTLALLGCPRAAGLDRDLLVEAR